MVSSAEAKRRSSEAGQHHQATIRLLTILAVCGLTTVGTVRYFAPRRAVRVDMQRDVSPTPPASAGYAPPPPPPPPVGTALPPPPAAMPPPRTAVASPCKQLEGRGKGLIGEGPLRSHYELVRNHPGIVSPLPALYLGEVSRFRPLFATGRTAPIRVLVLGGSMTAGIGCEDKAQSLKGNKCSYSARFVIWLRKFLPGVKIEYKNAARGGTQSEVGVATLALLIRKDDPPDLVITDFSVNDVYESGGIRDGMGATQRLRLATEALALGIKYLAPHALHMIVWGQCPQCINSRENRNYEAVRSVAEFHCLPFYDLRKISEFGPKFLNWTLINPVPLDRHPIFPTHQFYADMLSELVMQAYRRSCAATGGGPGLPKPPSCKNTSVLAAKSLEQDADLKPFMQCLEPITVLHAFNPPPDLPVQDGWKLFEDRPGKPGWITTRKHSIFRLNVEFGKIPTLAISFLRSYQGVGDATLRINKKSVKLKGDWEDPAKRTSVTHVIWFSAKHDFDASYIDGEMGISGFGVVGGSKHEAELEFTGPLGKFKLISIMTC